MKKYFWILFVLLSINCFGDLDDEKKTSVSLKTSLENSFSIISKISNLNIFLDESIPRSKMMNLELENLTIKEILDVVLKLNNLKMEKINNNSIIIFPESKASQYTTRETRTFYLKNANSTDMGSMLLSSMDPGRVYINSSMNSITVTANYDDMEKIKKIINEQDGDSLFAEKTYFLSYTNPQDMMDALSKITYITRFSMNTKLNSITVVAKNQNIDKVDNIVKTLDVKPSQVVIEVLLLDASSNFTKELGLKWDDVSTIGTASLSGAKFQKLLLPDSIVASLSKNYADILSNPSIRVVNNETAKISIGERVPIVIGKPTGVQSGTEDVTTVPSVEYKNVGIQLEAVPNIHLDNEVSIKLNLEVSSILEMKKTGKNGEYEYPSFLSKNISTVVRLKDGETVIFGGLVSNEQRKSKTVIPFFGEIPLIGRMFSVDKEEPKKSEIVMLITPHVLNNIRNNRSIDFEYKRSQETEEMLNRLKEKLKKEVK